MVSYLLLLLLLLIPSCQGVDVNVIDYREPTIANAFNNDSNPLFYPSLEVAAVANNNTQDRLFLPIQNTIDD
jgi:hypothetical protein